MSILDSIKSLFGSEKKSEEQTASKPGSYVDWLPHHMIGAGLSNATIDSKQALPGANKFSGSLPEAITVINRLKILSGLSPMQYDEPKSGQFIQEMKHCRLTIQTRFTDVDGSSRCVLSVNVRAK